MNIYWKRRLALIGAVLLVAVPLVYATFFTGTVTSPVTVTSTGPPPAPMLAITSATANGVACTVNSATSATCGGVSIGQGGNYSIAVTVTNTGNAVANPVTASASAPGLSGATVNLTSGTTSQSIAASGGTGSWTFTYTAGQTTGTDAITITITA